MAPFKSTGGLSVGKLLGVFRNRDLTLNSSVRTDRYIPIFTITTTNADSINTSGNYKYATWITPGSFVVTVSTETIEYLLIGGGGEGAGQNVSGSGGNPSTALGLTAYGGGYGSGYPSGIGGVGGSGGGSGGGSSPPPGGWGLNPSTPIPVLSGFPQYVPGTTQGYPGGSAPAVYGGSGGGGAGAAGEDGDSNSTWRVGAIGRVAFSGDTDFPSSYGTAGPTPGRWFAAGGGGAGGNPHGAAATQPVGGGGAGKTSTSSPPGDGLANTGSGGGGYCAPTGGGSGGGGAGGFLEGSMIISPGPYSITIGSGGSGGNGGNGADGIFVLRAPATAIVT